MSKTAKIVNFNRGKQPMPSQNGYVNLWRDINKQPWSKQTLPFALFSKLLTKVQHKPYMCEVNGIKMQLLAGECAVSWSVILDMFDEIKDKSHARRIIKKFVSLSQIYTKEIKKGRVDYGFIIGISGWEKWQNCDTPTDTPTDTPEVTYLKCLNGYADTPRDTPTDTQRNNNDINNNKDTCQKTKVFSHVPNQEITQLFAEILPSLPQPKKLTAARKSSIKARHVNDLKSDLNNWRKYFEYIRDNCSWMISGNFNITFDYLIKQANIVAIMEGAKNDRA